MAILCLEYRAVTVEYFLDKMQWYEIVPLMTNLHLTVKTGWEQTRQMMFSALSPYLKSGTKLKDIIYFPWDKENKNELVDLGALTEEKRKQMFSNAAKIREQIENNKHKQK